MPGGTKPNNGNGASGEAGPHDEFLALCAISTSGELSPGEQKRLDLHLAGCSECREALREFESVAALGAPLVASALADADTEKPERASKRRRDSALPSAGRRSNSDNDSFSPSHRAVSGPSMVSGESGRSRSQVNWNSLWIPFAASVALILALGVYSYRAGAHHGSQGVSTKTSVTLSADGAKLAALEQQLADAGHDRELLEAQAAASARLVEELGRQLKAQSAALHQAQSAQANLEQQLANDRASSAQAARQQNDAEQKLRAAEASLSATEAELASAQQDREKDSLLGHSLEAQINNLNAELRSREQALSKQDDLLADDRDIRDLMGARDLYIAEVYDVGRDGRTRKPYGRVFYTKGKSLVFYAYDLDQQPGVKDASTFQAWGQNGPSREQVINLGIFYEDSAAKKRWVLKFDNSQKLAEINAVFVTVEPDGGSSKPGGKPLLFASLRIQPNHP